MAKGNFGEGPLFTITNYIFWFSVPNLFFWLLNPLQFILILCVDPGKNYSDFFVLLYLASLPMGPALAALLSVMGKLNKEKDLTVTKDFFKAYKVNFKQALFLWFIESTSFAVIIFDISFFRKLSLNFLVYPLYAVSFAIFMLGLFAFPIMTKYYFSTTDLLKLSFLYSVKKFKVTFMCIVVYVLAFLLLRTKVDYVLIFFIVSLMCYSIMYYFHDIFDDINKNYVTEDSSVEDNLSEEDNEDLIFKDTAVKHKN